jgi:hypothetical protein
MAMMPARQFSDDDEAAQHWLMLLRDGDPDQKIQAREQLAAVFERRGLLEEATELLISNLHDGVRSADIFRWLARLYRNQGQEVIAMQAAAEAAKYMAPRAPSEGPSPISPQEPPLQLAAPVASPRAMASGSCLTCGYVNVQRRTVCKQCRAPLSSEPTVVPGANAPIPLLNPSPIGVHVVQQSSSGLAGCFKVTLAIVGMLIGGVMVLLVSGAVLNALGKGAGSSTSSESSSTGTGRSGKSETNLGTRPLTYGSQEQARDMIAAIAQDPGKAEYSVSYSTEIDAVVIGADFTKDVLARVHQKRDGHGTTESWRGYIMDRLRSASAGGSLNDTPGGKSLVDFRSF